MELKIQRVLSCQQMWTSYYRVVNSHLALLALSESVEMAMVRSVRKTVSAGRSWLGPGGKYLTQESLHGSHLKAAAAAAKSLQSCLTLCDPIDGSPPGSPIPGILQARTLEWVAISFSNSWKWKVKVKSLSRVQLLAIPHGLQPTRLLYPWDFPGKSTGVGCHCLLHLKAEGKTNHSYQPTPVWRGQSLAFKFK